MAEQFYSDAEMGRRLLKALDAHTTRTGERLGEMSQYTLEAITMRVENQAKMENLTPSEEAELAAEEEGLRQEAEDIRTGNY